MLAKKYWIQLYLISTIVFMTNSSVNAHPYPLIIAPTQSASVLLAIHPSKGMSNLAIGLSRGFIKAPGLLIPFLIILGITYSRTKNENNAEKTIQLAFGIWILVCLFLGFTNPRVLESLLPPVQPEYDSSGYR